MFNLFGLGVKSEFDLDGTEFKSKYTSTKGAVLIDVRTPGEVASGTINGSLNINYNSSQFNTEIANLDKNKTYFLFCRSGARSGAACKMMAKMGYTAYNLDNGIGAWPR
ncbi:MAG: rhodanese-like domain-containing protein [Flammeovirgaceae bacterium]|nr:rhodanese-like domain-containing protein [Flammeovirgaceae bacterium]